MNGFEFCEKVLGLDINNKHQDMLCFISSADVNIEALREAYPKSRSIGCFIKKPKRLCRIRLVVGLMILCNHNHRAYSRS